MASRTPTSDPRRSHEPGRVVLIRPASFMLMALVAAMGALALLAYLCMGEYTQRTHVAGLLAPDHSAIAVLAPEPGQVTSRFVREGQAVKAGELLFVVMAQAQAAAPAAAASAPPEAAPAPDAAPAHPSATDQATVVERLRKLKAESSKVGRQIAAQQEALAASRAEIKRLRAVIKENVLSDSVVQQQLDKVLEQRSQLHALEQKRMRLAGSMSTAQTELDQLAAQPLPERPARMAAAPGALAATQPARELRVTAPIDGTVSVIMADHGMATAGQTLLTITPANAALEAWLYVPSNRVGLVQSGQKVHLRYRALPQQPFTLCEGTVADVSLVASGRRELEEAAQVLTQPSQAEIGVHRIRVTLARQTVTVNGKAQRLSAGMQVDADIIQGSRPLLEWAFEPRYGTKERS